MSKAERDRGPPALAITKLISEVGYRHHSWQTFQDFVEMAAISISNAVDLPKYEPREARYLEIVKRYNKDELALFPQMFAELVNALEEEPDDILGRVFHELELHNKYTGQFFTPMSVCNMMAKMNVDESTKAIIERKGFVSASEPACGAGAMVIALANAMRDEGINYQQHLHVTAVDVDAKCVHMAYLQFSLLHIPAIIVHGNSISLEEYGRWYTPAHIMGGWNAKLRRARDTQTDEKHEIIAPPAPVLPVPAEVPMQSHQLSLF